MEFNTKKKKNPVEYRDYESDWRKNGQQDRRAGAGKLVSTAGACKPKPKVWSA